MKYACQTCGHETESRGGICTECGGVMVTEGEQEPELTLRDGNAEEVSEKMEIDEISINDVLEIEDAIANSQNNA